MRLKKAEKKKYKQVIKDAKEQKIVSLETARATKWAWSELVHDHFSELKLALNHIGKRPLTDALETDCIDGEILFNTKGYFNHYSDWEINRILNVELKNAKAAITYFEKLAKEEIKTRKSKST